MDGETQVTSSAHELLRGLETTYGECPMTFTTRQIGSLVLRVQDAFLDSPTLQVTLPQAQRAFGIDAFTCHAVLGALVEAHVLARTCGGVYMRNLPRQAHAA
jgi:hypothetical protein